MDCKFKTELGLVTVNDDVIIRVAGYAALDCYGIVGMASVSLKDGFVRLLKRDSLHKGIEVTVTEDNTVSLGLHIIVAYGVSIYAVSENLIETVRYQIQEQTGLKVDSINVFVEGVRPID